MHLLGFADLRPTYKVNYLSSLAHNSSLPYVPGPCASVPGSQGDMPKAERRLHFSVNGRATVRPGLCPASPGPGRLGRLATGVGAENSPDGMLER